MSNIPKARAQIIAAQKLLASALNEMTRESPVRQAPRREMKPIPAKVKQLVHDLAVLHPEWNVHLIANASGLMNSGRVSEILSGKRGKQYALNGNKNEKM
jgi:hypothetical protein